MNFINFLAESVFCGPNNEIEIAGEIVSIVRVVYNGIKIGVPIILIIVGMIGMGKAITSQKEDDIKKAQSTLVKQAIAAVIVFLMFYLVQLLMGVIGETGSNWDCVKKLLTNKGNETSESGKNSGSQSEQAGDYNTKSSCENKNYVWYGQCIAYDSHGKVIGSGNVKEENCNVAEVSNNYSNVSNVNFSSTTGECRNS